VFVRAVWQGEEDLSLLLRRTSNMLYRGGADMKMRIANFMEG
jgi:hypothetical protein